MNPEHALRLENPERQQPFNKTLVKDFFLSFQFSQGSKLTQNTLFILLNRYYQENVDQTVLDQTIGDPNQLLSKFRTLNLPKSHSQKLGVSLEDKASAMSIEFEEEGVKFINILCSTKPDLTLVTAADVCKSTIFNDVGYQNPSFPRSYRAVDPHGSYFRDYILTDKSTGSDAYDSIFHQAFESYANGQLDNDGLTELKKLERMWNNNHEEQNFWLPTDAPE
jgi:hypothetical protein